MIEFCNCDERRHFSIVHIISFKVGVSLRGRGSGVGGRRLSFSNRVASPVEKINTLSRKIHGYCGCLHSSIHVCLFCSGAWLLFCLFFFFFFFLCLHRTVPAQSNCWFADWWHSWCMCVRVLVNSRHLSVSTTSRQRFKCLQPPHSSVTSPAAAPSSCLVSARLRRWTLDEEIAACKTKKKGLNRTFKNVVDPLCVFFFYVLCVLYRSLTAASHSTWIQGYVGMGVFPRSEVCQPVWTSERSLAQTHGDSQPDDNENREAHSLKRRKMGGLAAVGRRNACVCARARGSILCLWLVSPAGWKKLGGADQRKTPGSWIRVTDSTPEPPRPQFVNIAKIYLCNYTADKRPVAGRDLDVRKLVQSDSRADTSTFQQSLKTKEFPFALKGSWQRRIWSAAAILCYSQKKKRQLINKKCLPGFSICVANVPGQGDDCDLSWYVTKAEDFGFWTVQNLRRRRSSARWSRTFLKDPTQRLMFTTANAFKDPVSIVSCNCGRLKMSLLLKFFRRHGLHLGRSLWGADKSPHRPYCAPVEDAFVLQPY